MLSQLEEVCAPVVPFERMVNKDGQVAYEPVPQATRSLKDRIVENMPQEIPFTGDKGIKLQDVADGLASMEGFVAQLTPEDLEALSHGDYIMGSSLGALGNAGVLGNAGQTNYAAAKAGIIGMTRSLAREWGRYGVNVNAVAFGYVLTRMTEKGIPPAQAEMLLRSIPLGRGATVQEAAGAVALLCYPESNYISGHVLMATGGM